MAEVRESNSCAIIVALLVLSSSHWLHYLTGRFAGAAGGIKAGPRASQAQWQDIEQVKRDTFAQGGIEWYKEELRKALMDNARLKGELALARSFGKQLGQDLRFLQVEIAGELYRQHMDAWIINAGADMQVRQGDLVVQAGRVVGTVRDVARTCSLVEDMMCMDARLFVSVEGGKDEYLCEGEGNGVGFIKVHKDGMEQMLNKNVHLSNAYSLGRHFLAGRVVAMEDRYGDGWLRAQIQGFRVEYGRPLHVIQETERKSPELFERKDDLVSLKEQVRKIEQQKLWMELLKK